MINLLDIADPRIEIKSGIESNPTLMTIIAVSVLIILITGICIAVALKNRKK